jgi:hypothetical protein
MLMVLMADTPASSAVYMSGLMAHRLSIELAILRINEEQFLPRNTTLMGMYADTKGDNRNAFMASLRCFLSHLESVRVPVAYGAMTSPSTVITASLSTEWNIPTISGSATAATLSDKTKYPYFTRAAPSDATLALSFLVLCQKLKWTQVCRG